MKPFPLNVASTNLSATTTSTNPSSRLPDGGSQLIVKNSGSVEVFVATGVGSATAVSASSMSVLPGTVEVFTIPENHTHVAAITAAGSTTVRVYRGYGE
jgi:ABC-type uncharacterized transport system YnjBCD substrate-binding protein